MVQRVKFEDQKDDHSSRSNDSKLVAGSHDSDTSNHVKRKKSFSQSKPETTHSLFAHGCARLELQQYLETRKAIADFTQCIELLPQNTLTLFACELYHKRAVAYQTIGKHNDAIKDYSESIDRCRSLGEQGKPLLIKGLAKRGLTQQAMLKLGLAMKDVNEANRLTDNKDPYCLCCRASVFAAKHEYSNAIAQLEEATKVGCDRDVEALLQRASVHSDLGKQDLALTDLEKALTLSHENIQKADIYYRRGVCDYALKNKTQAFSSFEQAVKLNPHHARAHFRIGMMKAEKGQLKEALRSLSKAHELAPDQRDILLERAIINRKLGNADDAADDVDHGMQLNSPTHPKVPPIENHITKLEQDVEHHGSSAHSHLELAMAYDGQLRREKDPKVREATYDKAVHEYRSAIETDSKYMYPQARALLILCHREMNDIIQAHLWHQDFYNVLFDHPVCAQHWKTYITDVNEKTETNKLETFLDESAVRKLNHMELNRRAMKIDVDNYRDDVEDRYKNQLAFYLRFRTALSDVLVAIAMSTLDSDTITVNLQGTPSKAGNILELFSGNAGFVPEIEAILTSDAKASTRVIRKADLASIQKKLKLIGSVGDLTDQVEIAQLVARHMCTRYRSQFICLKPTSRSTFKSVETVSSTKSSLNCCSSSQVSSNQASVPQRNKTVEQVAIFATAFVIHAIINEHVRSSTNENLSRREAVASMLVLIVCRAQRTTATTFFQSINFNETNNLLVEQSAILKMLGQSRRPLKEEKTVTIEWDLYDFFRAPGIYYYFGGRASNDDDDDDDDGNNNSKIYYGDGPSMQPETHGYRLGTQEEVAILEE